MPLLTVRDGARSVVRRVDRPIALDTLCPSPPPVPYAGGWLVRPEGESLAVIAPGGRRHGTLAPGAPLELGTLTLTLGPEGDLAARTHTTERLAPESRPRLALLVHGRRVALGTRALSLGKNPRCDVSLPDPTVSDLHAVVTPTRSGWELRDQGSTNGTRVDGVRVEAALLAPGMSVALGRTRLACVALPDEEGERRGEETAAPVLVGASPAMEAVRQEVARFARTDYPVLVQGETGSGKELVARLVHEHSRRARGPFVAINAATIAPELVESELFGHERGAFTGAVGRRRGVFEEASGGTLFLDELGELPLPQQAKLLRVLETREIRRVGAEGVVRVDVRVVCATHRDLAARVAEGLFRDDLRFRLDVLRVSLPPLRERPDDLPALARHLMARVATELGRPRALEDAAVAALLEYHWPGNVRELYGVLCRAAALADGERVGVEHLVMGPARSSRSPASEPSARGESGTPAIPPPPPLPRDLQGPQLQALVEQCGGNLSRAARAMGVARSTLRDRLHRPPQE